MKPQAVTRNDSALYFERTLVTPELALKLLESNTNNRTVRDSHVKRLARDMQEGRWLEDASPIKFSRGGRLLDGQHRLWAVSESGATVWMAIAYNVADAAYDVMDSGLIRATADVLNAKGEKNAKRLQSTLTSLHFWDKKWLHRLSNSSLRPTKQEALTLLEKYPEIRKSVNFGSKMVDLMSPSMAAFFHFVFGQKDAGLCEWFFDALLTGINLNADMGVYWLRKRLLDDRASKAKISDVLKVALTIKAWNSHRNGTVVRSLKVGEDEKFPEIC